MTGWPGNSLSVPMPLIFNDLSVKMDSGTRYFMYMGSIMRGHCKVAILGAVAAAGLWAGAAVAQTDPSIRTDIDRAFNQLFNSPGDPGLTYGYAQLRSPPMNACCCKAPTSRA